MEDLFWGAIGLLAGVIGIGLALALLLGLLLGMAYLWQLSLILILLGGFTFGGAGALIGGLISGAIGLLILFFLRDIL